MSDNRRSKTITQGVQRSPNRALLRAVGFGDQDFDKPIVGVANAHSSITPWARCRKRLAPGIFLSQPPRASTPSMLWP